MTRRAHRTSGPSGARLDDLRLSELRSDRQVLCIMSYPLPDPALAARLTFAEREVLVLLLAGETNAEIARRRGRAERTVANQVAAIFRKLAVRSRSELVLRCRELRPPTE